jgi:DNA-binding MarR family transcriptional regulator
VIATDTELTNPLLLAGELRAQFRHLLYLLRNLGHGDGLTSAQISTLNALAERPRRMGELATLSGVRLPSATDQVTRLERDGLVVRRKDPNELRAVIVTLTEEGHELLARVNAQRDKRLAERLAQLSDAERTALAAALPVIGRLTEI